MATSNDTQIRLQRLYESLLSTYLALSDINLAAVRLDMLVQDREPRFAYVLGLCMEHLCRHLEEFEKYCVDAGVETKEGFKHVTH